MVEIGDDNITKLNWSLEIIEAVEEYYDSDVSAQANILNELYMYTSDTTFRDELEQLCKEHKICPYCFNPMTKDVHLERRGDDPTYDEKVTEYECKICDI